MERDLTIGIKNILGVIPLASNFSSRDPSKENNWDVVKDFVWFS